jgi:sulfonate transport system ATP-binding protein
METNKSTSIDIIGVSKSFHLQSGELQVLQTTDFQIHNGEFISIVGKSGCGKSTLLRILAGLETATTGEVRIGSRKVERPSVLTGLIFQEPRLFPWLTVEQNIAFGIHKNMGKKEKKSIIEQHLELVGLKGFEKALPRQLSGGMQQRVSFARALINNPSVLMLDEPFGALDSLTRITMQNEVLRLWETEKSTMVLVTHDIDEAIYLSDRIVVMSERPGAFKKIIEVPLIRPRERSSPRFVEIRKEIYTEFFADSALSIEYYI